MLSTKSILTLLKGNLISQILPIIFYPLITRLFSAHEFGIYSILLSFIMTFSVLSVLKLDQAIPIASNKEKDQLIRISFIFNLIFCTFLYIVLSIYSILAKDSILTNLTTLLMVITIFVNGCSNILVGLNISLGQFKENSKYQVYRAVIITLLQILFGLIGYITYGLIISFFLAQLISLMYLVYLYRKKLISLFQYPSFKEDFKLVKFKYSDFPKYLTFTSLINTLGNNIPNIFFNSTYGIIYAGYYGIVTRAFLTPLYMVSISIAQPFLKEISENQNSPEKLKNLSLKIFNLLTFIIIVPLGLLSFNMEHIFSKIFSDEWKLAGKVAIFITPWIIVNFILSPLTHIYTVTRKQNINLVLNIVSVTLRVTIIIASYKIGVSFFEMLLLFGITNFLLSIIQLITIFKVLKLSLLNINSGIIFPLFLCMIASYFINRVVSPWNSIILVSSLILFFYFLNRNKIKELFI